MKKLLLLFIFISIQTNSFSQTDSTKISFIAYWSIGDAYEYKVSKIKQQYKEGKLTKDTKKEYTALFKVLDSTENSYTISWKYENDLGNSFKIPEKVKKEFAKYKFTEIKYKTTELGEFEEILNWEEVRDLLNNMIQDLVNILGPDDDKTKDILEKTLGTIKELYSTKQGIEQLVLKELQYFHFPMSYEFNPKKTLSYEDLLPNIFGGDPIKAETKVYFESVDEDDGFCVFKQELDINPEDALEMLKLVFKKMGIKDKKFKEQLKSSKIDIKDRNIYEYYYNPGIPHRIETMRESIININNEKGKRIDKIIIELQYEDEE
jgi:hypothetical protein